MKPHAFMGGIASRGVREAAGCFQAPRSSTRTEGYDQASQGNYFAIRKWATGWDPVLFHMSCFPDPAPWPARQVTGCKSSDFDHEGVQLISVPRQNTAVEADQSGPSWTQVKREHRCCWSKRAHFRGLTNFIQFVCFIRILYVQGQRGPI